MSLSMRALRVTSEDEAVGTFRLGVTMPLRELFLEARDLFRVPQPFVLDLMVVFLDLEFVLLLDRLGENFLSYDIIGDA